MHTCRDFSAHEPIKGLVAPVWARVEATLDAMGRRADMALDRPLSTRVPSPLVEGEDR